MRIVFLGTPDFAVASLAAIIEEGFEVVGVVTAPDKPAGRGMQLQQSPVKQYAVSKGIQVLQPIRLKDPVFIEELRNLKADLQVVIAFRMLPEVVWQMPKLGTINLHASLLPDYRGAAPINWAIINGEKESGVCTFFLKHEIDTGDILLKAKTTILPNTNAGELHDTLMELGAKTIVTSLKLIEDGKTNGSPQGNESIKIAPKIFKSHCEIRWDQTGENIYNLIRGMSPYPAAYTHIQEKMVKVFKANFLAQAHQQQIGTIDTDGKTYLHIASSNGWISLLEVQQESKKRMSIEEFLRGFKRQA
jgi:methionyl-tRNA formyltransferase